MDVRTVPATASQGTGTSGTSAANTTESTAVAESPQASALYAQQTSPGSHSDEVATLKEPVQRLYGGGTDIEVTFRVEHDPNQVVTVFRDANTGKEIAQFPPEVMIQLAEFFQHLAGAVVDRSA